ncbi:hypothetical protein SteCoe_27506 [Stentor coeruleus]|uniref:ABC transporter domain-containing protein n=1 Tax=Stentor coeruleus TaxID=5963 RepID=A0A1R2BAF5_9CILI|nr:hypothetical protein SteCoe_27506 [Stentor coeruleus]
MGVWSQYRALLFKNWILWKRKIFGSLCEVLFPIGLIIVVGLIRSTSLGTDYDKQDWATQVSKSYFVSPDPKDYPTSDPNSYNVNPHFQNPFRYCSNNVGGDIYSLSYSIITNDADIKEDFTNYMVERIRFLSENALTEHKEFDTISDLEDYIVSSDYEDYKKICFAVYLDKISNKKYEVSFRYNTTENFIEPGKRRLGDFIDIFYMDNLDYNELTVSPTDYAKNFYNYGFLTLNNLVHNFMLNNKLNQSGFIKATIAPMRFDKYVEDTFLTSIGGILSFFIIISYLVPVSRLLSSIVQEKETKTKEMMMMMGLSNSAYWLSWITYYTIIYTVVSIVLTILIIQMKVFTNSNGGLVFLYFWIFGMACLSFSIFLSMFFSKSRSAVLVGVPVFLGSYFVSFAVNDPLVSMNKKSGASLLPTVAFTLATNVITQLETGEAGIQNSNTSYDIENYNFAIYIGVIIVDIVYMSLLAAYLEVVWPSEWGVKKPWYFLFTKTFWCPKKIHTNEELFEQDVHWGDSVEPVDQILENQKATGKAMLVRNLTKRFANKVAVENLNLDIYEGQIFALLGHNGAGKTTTMSMMAGLIPASAGDMTINGNFLSKDLFKIREHLGVCPQHNILFPDLNAEEHLYLFCIFKGITDNDKIREMSHAKLNELELMPQAEKRTKYMSGGQKRKLSLAIALIGDSPIVLLDEPTSGMDLTGRRHMWDMLKNNKAGRIIILTTHYMEEADVLADRIAIMSEGKLRCCGSSLFLKSRYGVGYYLTMVKSQEAINNSRNLENFVVGNITGAKLMTDFQGEITFQLPSSSSPEFINFFENLDQSLSSLGLLSYSISATTLEEVFLRVARGSDEKLKAKEELPDEDEDDFLFENEFVLVKDRVKGSLFWSHFVSLTKKRATSSRRDFKTLLFEIFIPIVLIIIGLSLMLIPSILSNYGAYKLTLNKYESTQNVLYSGSSDGTTLINILKSNYDINPINAGKNTCEDMSDYVYDQRDLQPKLTSSYYFDNINKAQNEYFYTAFFDQRAFQAPAIVYNAMAESILKSIDADFDIVSYNHPFPVTKEMDDFSGSGDGFTGSLIFSLGFSFIPTGIVLFISKEREVNVKHQHMISGVSLFAYWVANFVWDVIKHVIPTIVCSLIILAYQIDIYTDKDNDYGAMWVLIALNGIASAPFSYFFSFFFKSHSTAQIVMLIVSFITGSCLPSAVFVMYIFDSSRNAGKVLSWILRVFPNFCFGWGVLRIGSATSFSSLEETETLDAFDIRSAGGCMLFLGIFTAVYFILVIIMELFESNPRFAQFISRKKTVFPEVFEHDSDVDAEAATAENTDPGDVQVNVKRLCKSFKIAGKQFTAVNELSFNVKKEECFALLGINGAGKTTTFKMLTGEIPCDSGSAFVGGKNVSTKLAEARTLIGYCPQFDALTDNLTGKEHLEVYANIKGIPKNKIKEQVDYMLKYMDLEQYANILSGTYSGGNKRKLSVAMALIGNPSVVFLDEPSAGMDPEARKKMWKILGKIKKKKSAVILTTHSMEEAEALCDRMTIMVRGRLKCIGTSTWIKNKFGDGYELEIKIDIPSQLEINDFIKRFDSIIGSESITFSNLDRCLEFAGVNYLRPYIANLGSGAGIFTNLESDGFVTKEALASWCLVEHQGYSIKAWLEKEFMEVEIIEHYNLMSKFKLKKQHVSSIGHLFSFVEGGKEKMRISDYAICMTSLEQIFNRFAKRAEMEEIEKMRRDK